MDYVAQQLQGIVKELESGLNPKVSVREFLSWWGAQRRGSRAVWLIRHDLSTYNLITEPDFQVAYLDSDISFEIMKFDELGSLSEAASEIISEEIKFSDPTYRVSKLEAAVKGVVSAVPDAPIETVLTLMMVHDYSQIPIMTNSRSVKGVVTWRSIAQKSAYSGKILAARECMEIPHFIRDDETIFEAITQVSKYDHVLVRNEHQEVTGIITATDLCIQFKNVSESFLIISEIENTLRIMLHGKFCLEDFRDCADPVGRPKEVNSVNDLQFGDYIRLLENPERWSLFSANLDRRVFCERLNEVRRIRNDIVHFDPDGVPPEDIEKIWDFANFLKRIAALEAET